MDEIELLTPLTACKVLVRCRAGVITRDYRQNHFMFDAAGLALC